MSASAVYCSRDTWSGRTYPKREFQKEDLDCFKIGGSFNINHDTIELFLIGKGGGSAYAGKWKPSNPADEKFIGKQAEAK